MSNSRQKKPGSSSIPGAADVLHPQGRFTLTIRIYRLLSTTIHFVRQILRRKRRAVFIIDGFNLYHAIDNEPQLHRYKWLNLKGLTGAFVDKATKTCDIFYFTAYADWDQDKLDRHKRLVEIYKDLGIRVVGGAFRKRPRWCKTCKTTIKLYEEKRTDVNVATALIDLAFSDAFDDAYIISGDSDFIPAVETIRTIFPHKQFVVVIPIGRKAKELTKACGGSSHRIKLKKHHLSRNILPDPYITSSGKVISCPNSWT